MDQCRVCKKDIALTSFGVIHAACSMQTSLCKICATAPQAGEGAVYLTEGQECYAHEYCMEKKRKGMCNVLNCTRSAICATEFCTVHGCNWDGCKKPNAGGYHCFFHGGIILKVF